MGSMSWSSRNVDACTTATLRVQHRLRVAGWHTEWVKHTIAADIDADSERLFGVVADLATYPSWLELVTKVEPDGDGWLVTLRAKVGPFARSKRLRMIRTVAESPSTVRFERHELDGREHSPWVMDALVSAHGSGSHVDIVLSYGGRLWSGPLEAVLGSQVSSGVPRLQTYVAAYG